MKYYYAIYTTIFTSLVFLFSIPTAKSQIPDCLPGHNELAFPFERLENIPPYSTDMPYDVLLGYIAVDSAKNHASYEEFINFINPQTYNDTIKYMMKHYYQMVDYDPIKFALYRNHDSSDFHPLPVSIQREKFFKKLFGIVPHCGDYILTLSDIIAHIRVVDTTRKIDTVTTAIYPRSMIVTSEILDTIKGNRIPACVDFNPPIYERKQKPNKTMSLPNNCLQFEFALDWPRGKVDGSMVLAGDDGLPWTNIKPKLVDSTDTPWIVENKEYIVFLKLILTCKGENNIYYTLFPCGYGCSMTYGMFPINEGIVYDPENEFGVGNNLTVQEFKNALNNRIQEITTYGE